MDTVKTQENQTEAEIQQAMQKMQHEVKRKLKSESKNELIRIVGALLLDNYALKLQLSELMKASQQAKELEKNETSV